MQKTFNNRNIIKRTAQKGLNLSLLKLYYTKSDCNTHVIIYVYILRFFKKNLNQKKE